MKFLYTLSALALLTLIGISPIGGGCIFVFYLLYYIYEKYWSQTVNDFIEVSMTNPQLIQYYFEHKNEIK